MSKRKVIVTADDFGLSPGINKSIISLYKNSALTRGSLFAGCNYTEHAVELIKREAPDMPVGIHLSLNCGRCCASPAEVPLLADRSGILRISYSGILLKLLIPFRRHELLTQIRIEFEAQINRLMKSGISLTHIDGHRHVHMIPGIFQVVGELAEKYSISDVRVVNENIFTTLKLIQKGKPGIAGIIKLMLLKLFYRINNVKLNRYFFSILFSCKITPDIVGAGLIKKFPQKYDSMEIMLHPGDPDADRDISSSLNMEELPQIMSYFRREEFLAAIELKRLSESDI